MARAACWEAGLHSAPLAVDAGSTAGEPLSRIVPAVFRMSGGMSASSIRCVSLSIACILPAHARMQCLRQTQGQVE